MLRIALISSLLCGMLTGAAEAAPDSHSTEAQLAKSLQAIKNSRLDIALNEVDSLLRANPKFKLAHLVKGDLLMARAGAINSFGSAPNAPRDKIEDLIAKPDLPNSESKFLFYFLNSKIFLEEFA